MGFSILLAFNLNALIGNLESENIILAYIHEHFTEQEAQAVGSLIRIVPNVADVEFTSRYEAFESFIGRFEDQHRFVALDESVTRHRFAVYVHDIALIAETQEALSNVRGIASVSANLEIARGLVTLRTVVMWISVIIIAVLIAISLFIMSNTIKIATFERREEIAIMKMVGATNSFIRWPFIFEGFVLGLIGSLTAFFVIMALYELVTDALMQFMAGIFLLIPFGNVSIPLLMLFAGIGFAVGVGGSGLALNRYLKV